MQKHLCLNILWQPAKAIRFLLLWQACPLYPTPFFLVVSIEFHLFFFFSSLHVDLFRLFSQLAFSGVLLITSRKLDVPLCAVLFLKQISAEVKAPKSAAAALGGRLI